VSLSEIDLLELDRLASRHGEFGMAFRRSWVQEHGGAPVWYLPRGSVVQQKLFDRVRQLAFRPDPNLEHFLWEFTPFIDYPKDSDSPGKPYDWRWEREWRVVGDLEFRLEDIVVMFAPVTHHAAIRESWRRAAPEVPVPPLVDVGWGVDDQISAMKAPGTPAESPASDGSIGALPDRAGFWGLASEPPDDPAFEDLPESEMVPADPDARWLEEEADPDLKLMRELEADKDFDLDSLVWFEAEVLESSDAPEGDDHEGLGELDDNELVLADQSDDWEIWLEVAEEEDP
jgi:hypothetical protein